jgi:hypothetical protein
MKYCAPSSSLAMRSASSEPCPRKGQAANADHRKGLAAPEYALERGYRRGLVEVRPDDQHVAARRFEGTQELCSGVHEMQLASGQDGADAVLHVGTYCRHDTRRCRRRGHALVSPAAP